MGVAIIATLAAVALAATFGWVTRHDRETSTNPTDGLSETNALKHMIAVEPAQAQARVVALTAEAPDAQRAALADGEVTLAEYEAAVHATVVCLEQGFDRLASTPSGRAATLTMDPVVVSPDSFDITYTYVLETVPGVAAPWDQTAVTALEERCHRDSQQTVKDIYQTRALADPAYVTGVTSQFRTCARDAGVPSLGRTPEELFTTLQGLEPSQQEGMRRCFDRLPSVSIGLGSKVRRDG